MSYPLKAQAGREVRVSCGCRALVAVERALNVDREGASFDVGPPTLLVIPCGSAGDHLALARALAAEGGIDAPEDLAAAMEDALAT